jgi:preprotein translocase subunit SecE
VSGKGPVSRFLFFVKDVRQELDRITWPSRKEIVITTIVVFVMAAIGAVFFSIVDTIAFKVVHSVIIR